MQQPEVSPLVARVLALGVGLGLYGVLCVYSWLKGAQYLRLAQAEREASSHAADPLRPGTATVVGVVQARGGHAPVVVRIHQQGTDYSIKGSRHHQWLETSREIEVHPFKLARSSGDLVRIEPDQRILLAHPLDGLQPGGMKRVRFAALEVGTRVHVTGTLVRNTGAAAGSRADAAAEWVMRPPSRGRMVIASESLADHHTRRARRMRQAGFLTLAVLLLSHGLVFLRFDALALFGRVVDTPEERVDTHVDWKRAKTPGARPTYRVVHTRRVEHVPYLVAGPFRQVGRAASISPLTLIFYGMFSPVLLVIAFFPNAMDRRWWESPRILDTGRGDLRPDTIDRR